MLAPWAAVAVVVKLYLVRSIILSFSKLQLATGVFSTAQWAGIWTLLSNCTFGSVQPGNGCMTPQTSTGLSLVWYLSGTAKLKPKPFPAGEVGAAWLATIGPYFSPLPGGPPKNRYTLTFWSCWRSS